MNHEKIIVRPEGNKVKIRVNFWMRYDNGVYDIDAYTCEKGKRTWKCIDYETYDYRRLSETKDRIEYRNNLILKHVTPEEIHEAKKELWQKLAPVQQ